MFDYFHFWILVFVYWSVVSCHLKHVFLILRRNYSWILISKVIIHTHLGHVLWVFIHSTSFYWDRTISVIICYGCICTLNFILAILECSILFLFKHLLLDSFCHKWHYKIFDLRKLRLYSPNTNKCLIRTYSMQLFICFFMITKYSRSAIQPVLFIIMNPFLLCILD